MIQTMQKYLEIFNLKGGVLMGVWTLTLIVMTALGKPIDPSAIRAYEVSVAVYGLSKGNKLWVESQVTKKMEAGDV